jgi:hypothetical protein
LRRVTPRIVKGDRSMFFEDKGNRVIGAEAEIHRVLRAHAAKIPCGLR